MLSVAHRRKVAVGNLQRTEYKYRISIVVLELIEKRDIAVRVLPVLSPHVNVSRLLHPGIR